MQNQRLSKTYLFLRKCGLNFSEREYGQISFTKAIKKAYKTWRNGLLLKYCMYSAFLGNLNYRLLRPKIWRIMGCTIGNNVFIGYEVWMDIGNSELITLEDNVHIANRCTLLCHQRNLSNYFVGSDYAKQGYIKLPIHLKKGCLLGMGVLIMPGVTVGEGSIIGAGSIVTKDVPDWTVAMGNPAKVVKSITHKEKC